MSPVLPGVDVLAGDVQRGLLVDPTLRIDLPDEVLSRAPGRPGPDTERGTARQGVS
jgi:hypothetical protein